jgi:hypothetical protein
MWLSLLERQGILDNSMAGLREPGLPVWSSEIGITF